MSFGNQPTPCPGFTRDTTIQYANLLESLRFTQSSDEFFLTASNQIVNDLRAPSLTSCDIKNDGRPRNLFGDGPSPEPV